MQGLGRDKNLQCSWLLRWTLILRREALATYSGTHRLLPTSQCVVFRVVERKTRRSSRDFFCIVPYFASKDACFDNNLRADLARIVPPQGGIMYLAVTYLVLMSVKMCSNYRNCAHPRHRRRVAGGVGRIVPFDKLL